MFPNGRLPRKMRGSALMIALFVIVVMALLAAALGRLLTDSSEQNTVEVRSLRALLAAQSGLEISLYRLFPRRTLAQPQPPARCETLFTTDFPGNPGLVGCQVQVRCVMAPVTYNGVVSNGYRLTSEGTCSIGVSDALNPDFSVQRTVTVAAYDGGVR
ncbi:MSHA biogenesis protein MshP [Aeromonas cavernicola]|uniref:MSHA biogenesis protein MshP n=1 Tax=Aeromonas cavernicola TaxID=1006623 RepID=A0A2H9U257_9GAMM|nr:MSHA biogenesis protein MshP [Aeromonas cavernicola]PJG58156.1 MSHA biogenesis protein MshP [Aeromonas cavernicola]